MKMKYKIITGIRTHVEEEVNKLIKKGWKPSGGACWVSGGFYAQAMVLEEHKPYYFSTQVLGDYE